MRACADARISLSRDRRPDALLKLEAHTSNSPTRVQLPSDCERCPVIQLQCHCNLGDLHDIGDCDAITVPL